MKLLIVLGACLLSLPAQAVNKCTMPDGRVVYSDAPCAADARAAATLSAAPVVAPMAPRPTRPPGQQGAAADPPTLQIPPPLRLHFSGLPESDLSLSISTMDKIRMLGRDCDWALRVDKAKMQACVDFMTRMQPQGEFDQISTRVRQVLAQDPALERRSRNDLRRYELFRGEALDFKQAAMSLLSRSR
jgi:hypothetical protein